MLTLVALAFGIAIGIGVIALLVAIVIALLIQYFKPAMPVALTSRLASGVIPVPLSLFGFSAFFTGGDELGGPAAQGLLVIFVISFGLLFVAWPVNNKLVSVFLRNHNT